MQFTKPHMLKNAKHNSDAIFIVGYNLAGKKVASANSYERSPTWTIPFLVVRMKNLK